MRTYTRGVTNAFMLKDKSYTLPGRMTSVITHVASRHSRIMTVATEVAIFKREDICDISIDNVGSIATESDA